MNEQGDEHTSCVPVQLAFLGEIPKNGIVGPVGILHIWPDFPPERLCQLTLWQQCLRLPGNTGFNDSRCAMVLVSEARFLLQELSPD